MKQSGSISKTNSPPKKTSSGTATKTKRRRPPAPPPETKHLSDEEAALKPRREITVAQARVLFRKSIFTDEDLIRKSGMGRSSVDRFWSGALPKKGMAWRGIAGVLEAILVEHVRIKP